MKNDYNNDGDDEATHEEVESVGFIALLFFAVPLAIVVLLIAIVV
jgi:hypothetical protein